MESGIFIRNNLTDYEKLLFAQNHIKELLSELKNCKKQIGILKDEVSELRYENPSELMVMKNKLINLTNQNQGLKHNNKKLKKSLMNMTNQYINLKINKNDTI